MTHLSGGGDEMYLYNSDYEGQIKGRQIWQYKDQEIFDKLLEAYAETRQEYEDVGHQLLIERSLSDAEGVNLDRLGEFYNVPRNGQPDGVYRDLIITASARLQAGGQIEILLNALRLLAKNLNVALVQAFPATILMYIFVGVFGQTPDPVAVNTVMQATKAAGVQLTIAEQITSNEGFIFQSTNPAGGNVGEGFATLSDGSDGGSFASIIG
jgi:hypothetical protein